MTQAEEKEGTNKIDLFAKSRLAVFAQATSYTISILLVFGFVSYYIDKKLGTFPVIFIIGLAIAYPLTQFLLFKKVKQFAKKLK